MLVFAQEPLEPIWDRIMVLARQHWDENEQYRHGQGFNPDKARYLQAEKIGMYFHFTARDPEQIVGSGGLYITPSMHTQRVICQEDTYYLLPEYRLGRNAIRFFNFMEAFMVSRGVVECTLTTPITNTKAERIVEYMGYRQVGKGWSKELSYTEASPRSGITSREVRADSAIGENLMELSSADTSQMLASTD